MEDQINANTAGVLKVQPVELVTLAHWTLLYFPPIFNLFFLLQYETCLHLITFCVHTILTALSHEFQIRVKTHGYNND